MGAEVCEDQPRTDDGPDAGSNGIRAGAQVRVGRLRGQLSPQLHCEGATLRSECLGDSKGCGTRTVG